MMLTHLVLDMIETQHTGDVREEGGGLAPSALWLPALISREMEIERERVVGGGMTRRPVHILKKFIIETPGRNKGRAID